MKIRLLRKVAANVDEIIWHQRQRTTFQDDGSGIFESDVDGVDEMAWWVLRYGDQAQGLEPPELRDRVGHHAGGMLAFYEGNGQGAA